MKPHFQVAKLIIGILSILFSSMLLLTSCVGGAVAGMGQSVDAEIANKMSMEAGGVMLLGLAILVAGIVSIAERKSTKLSGDITCLVLSVIATISIPSVMGGSFYAIIFGIFSIFFLLSIIFKNKDKKKIDSGTEQTVE